MSEADNNRSDNTVESQESYMDPYVSESSADIYTTPEVVDTVDAVEETADAEVIDTHGLFSGKQPENPNPDFYQNYGGQTPYGNNQPYGNGQQSGGYGSQQPYENPYQQNSGYSGQQSYENPYQQGGHGDQQPYGNPYQQGGGYDSQLPYGNGQQVSGYNSQQPYGNSYQQGGGYGGQQSYGNPYQQGGGYGGQPPFGGQPPYDNPYSPYAMPQKKQHTGLIVGIVIGIIILFLIAVFALANRVVNLLSEKEKEDFRRDVYDFDNDYDYDDDSDDYLYDDYDYDDDYDDYFGGYDDDYGYDYDYDNDQYYTLHDELRYDLSYEVEFSYQEYETDYDNVYIAASMPVVLGEDVTNLGTINEEIQKEVDSVTEFFEEEYESHIKENEDAYFEAVLEPYVAYMDEDKLSIVYDERIYTDVGGSVELISINVDMKNGVVLDNEDMLAIDDEFSVDFRTRSDEQNGEVDSLAYMTDQQITDYFNSDNLIVYYTPKGMEIGFNFEDGWVTVTYEDYEQFLKVF